MKNRVQLQVGSKFHQPGDDAYCEVLEIDPANDTMKVNFHMSINQLRSLSSTENDLLTGRYEMIK